MILADLLAVSDELRALLLLLIERCHDAVCRKELIITAHCCGALGLHETGLIITALQLETA